MQHIRGENAGKGWLSRGEASMTRICQQLRTMMDEMRQIRRIPASHIVNAVDGGPIWDERLPWFGGDQGPFANVHDFHQYLRGGYEVQSESAPEVQTLIAI
jgi:hypothetical protein